MIAIFPSLASLKRQKTLDINELMDDDDDEEPTPKTKKSPKKTG